ncbi:MAG: hypothetical protein R3D02_00650 [Hyphomicrobiales bacterium]
MNRYVNAVLVAAMMAGVGSVYQLKYQVELAAEHLAEVKREINKEKEAIALLQAEWSLLNQPSRLQALVERHGDYLKLEPLKPQQLGTLADVPDRPPPAQEDGDMTASIPGQDPISTFLAQ